MSFWIFAGALGLIVTAALLVPLLRGGAVAGRRGDYDVNVYKDQLAELERDAGEGRIKQSELGSARLEIQRRLLAAAADTDNPSTASANAKWPLIGTAVAIPVLAVLFYLQHGKPGTPDFPLAARPSQQEVTADTDRAVTAMVQALEKRLNQEPNDPRGWVLLGRSFAAMGDMAKAADAMGRAVPMTDRDPAILADWAELRLMARDGAFTEDIFNDFVEARQRDPALPKPWFYIGLDRAQAGDLKEAAQIWTDLLTISPPDVPYLDAVRQKISEAAADGNFDAAVLQPTEIAKRIAADIAKANAEAAQTAPAPAAPGPSADDVKAAEQMSTEDRAAFIRSMVERLASRLEEEPNDPAGWERLIRAYEVLGETEKAEQARARLKAVQGN